MQQVRAMRSMADLCTNFSAAEDGMIAYVRVTSVAASPPHSRGDCRVCRVLRNSSDGWRAWIRAAYTRKSGRRINNTSPVSGVNPGRHNFFLTLQMDCGLLTHHMLSITKAQFVLP